jgi:hypothetical protein
VEEIAILTELVGSRNQLDSNGLETRVVEDMADGGMGSIRFKQQHGKSREFGKAVAEAEYVDADGIVVNIAVNVDERGELYEVDFWKVDFSPLLMYPKPAQLLKIVTPK